MENTQYNPIAVNAYNWPVEEYTRRYGAIEEWEYHNLPEESKSEAGQRLTQQVYTASTALKAELDGWFDQVHAQTRAILFCSLATRKTYVAY